MHKFIVSLLFASTAAQLGAQSVAVSTQQRGAAISTESLSAAVTLDLRDVRLRDALLEIGKQASLKVVFGDVIAKDPNTVTLRLSDVPASQAIAAAIRGRGITYRTTARGQVVFEKLSVGTARAQGVITGKVIDAKTGKGIPGATVSIGNDTRGAVTDEDGYYHLAGISVGTHTVSIRLVGYAKQIRSVTVGEGATATVDFKLETSASVLDQVVVTGTIVATELKAVPNAITVITAKQIEERGITRIDQLFRGEIPGMFSLETGASNSSNGTSMGEVTMFSRGATQLSSISGGVEMTNPIKTYVDGIEMANPQYLSQIDPKSIERIEILTGPQASTVYGANAINGVMQVFTKRGSTQRPSITLSLSEGWAQNNFNSALSPSHQYDISASGAEGRVSYNIGSGWDYAGAWAPSKQTQRTSVYGGGRYQTGVFSVDLSSRQGWTKNRQKGPTTQEHIARVEDGRFARNATIGLSGLITPSRKTLSGRTLGATIGFNPLPWWSHTLNVGSDASDMEVAALALGFITVSDTSFFNSQTPNSRGSQSYSSTLRFPLLSLAQTVVTFGADHWRSSTESIGWRINTGGALSAPSVTRTKPSKNSGAYVQGQLGFRDALFFTYGVRADWNPDYGDLAKVRPGRYGMSYAREFGVISAKLRGSYGRSIRPPAANVKQGSPVLAANNPDALVFYGNPLYSTLPNPELGPEFQQGGEGGIEVYMGNRGSLVITRYNQTVEGLIQRLSGVDSVRALQPGQPVDVNVTNCSSVSSGTTNSQALPRSDGYCYYLQPKSLNIGSIRNQGWEMQSSISVGPLTTRGTYSWTKSRVIGITPKYRGLLSSSQSNFFAPGQTFNYLPEHTWAMNISYAFKETYVMLNVNGMGFISRSIGLGELGPQFTGSLRLSNDAYRISQPSYRETVPGYTTANINASHRFSKKVEATFQVTNLTNYYHNDFDYRYPVLGRQSRFGLRMRWQ